MSDQALAPETVGAIVLWGGALVVLSSFVAWLAKQKGRNASDWFLLSLVFSPLLTFIFVAVAPKAEKKPAPRAPSDVERREKRSDQIAVFLPIVIIFAASTLFWLLRQR